MRSKITVPVAASTKIQALPAISGSAEPEIAGKAWILVDAATGTVILERNADLHLPPASLAKMMTTYLVSQEITENRLEEDTQVLISDNAWILGGAKTDGHLFLHLLISKHCH